MKNKWLMACSMLGFGQFCLSDSSTIVLPVAADPIKKPSLVRRFFNRAAENRKRKKKAVKVLNPLAEHCDVKKLSDVEESLLYAGGDLSFEKAEDFCVHFSKMRDFEYQGVPWKLVDGVALRLGMEIYTWKDMEQCVSMQKFLLENGEGGIVFGPGFSAMKALCDEAKLLGMSDGGTIAEEILDSVRAQWKISDLGEFFSVFKQRSGCSVSFFTAYLKQREIAMSMLHHFCPAKALTTTDFVNFLGKKGIAANIKYNVDIAVLQEADISNYRAGSFKPIWVFFGLRGASEFCDEVQQVLTRLSEGDISDPLFIGGEYWLVRKNGVDVSLDEKEVLSKEALSKEMRDIWMGESVAKVLPKISCGVVKTVNVNTQGG